jgi:hypothetical protein
MTDMQNVAKKKARKVRRVFLLGAGVSASVGIAVARDILRASIVQLEATDSRKAQLVQKLLLYLYPGFDEELRNYPNIEDFLNLLEMAKKFNTEEFIESTSWSRERLEQVGRVTVKAVTEYIWECMKSKAQGDIDEFVKLKMRPRDTIITFNWDLTVERALENYSSDASFLYTYSRERESDAFSLLKPHGSIDWFQKADIEKLDKKADILSLDSKLCVFPYFSRARSPKLLDASPVIVPPVASKEFDFAFLKRTWRGVYRAVSDATEVYVIGYSLPKEDQFARLVLRRALRNNQIKTDRGVKGPLSLTVVNPDENVGTTFGRLVQRGSASAGYYQATLQDYLNSLRD